MSSFPGPIRSDKAKEAERRLAALHRRFSDVSRSIDNQGGGTMNSNWRLTPFETVMIIGGVFVIIWRLMAHMFG